MIQGEEYAVCSRTPRSRQLSERVLQKNGANPSELDAHDAERAASNATTNRSLQPFMVRWI